MKAIFEILPGELDSTDCCLACEAAGKIFSYAVKNTANRVVSAGVYTFDDIHPQPQGSIVLEVLLSHHPVLSRDFKSSTIVFSLADAAIIPSMLFNNNKNQEVLNLLHGDDNPRMVILTDNMPRLDMHTIYRVNQPVFDLLRKQFPKARFLHQYSVLLQALGNTDTLFVVFFENQFTVALFLNGVCRLMNSFSFKAPEDVAYILLLVQKQFELAQPKVVLSGMIEENSALYKEVYKYFEYVDLMDFSGRVSMADDFAQYPAHFFTPIFALLLCES